MSPETSPDDIARELQRQISEHTGKGVTPMVALPVSPNDPGAGPEVTNPYPIFKGLGENDILLLFGKTKVGKTKICIETALGARELGKTVIFYDTEKNIHRIAVDELKKAKVDYRVISEISEIYRNLSRLQCDLLIIDSATIGITGRWFGKAMDEKGQLLLEVQHLYFELKRWAEKRQALVMITAQPISDFGDREFAPMGDKANYLSKEVLLVDRVRGMDYKTLKREVRAFDSRVLPDNTVVCQFTTTLVGVTFIKWGPEALEMRSVETPKKV